MSSETCSICEKPKKAQPPWSITQWIFGGDACTCGQTETAAPPQQSYDDNICMRCGNYVSSDSSGSITGWVLTKSRCNCGFQSITQKMEAQTEQLAEPEAEQDFSDLDKSSFPRARYKPLRLIGKSQAATSYKCFDLDIRRFVVVKQLQVLARDCPIRR